MTVRLEASSDRQASIEVERAAFGRPLEAAIAEAVRDEPGSFAFVADDRGEVVGHVQMSRAWVGEAAVLALGPIGVSPDRQGKGIGSCLVRAALEEARRLDETAVILLGDPAYYGRFGFVSASRYGLRSPYAGTEEEISEIEAEAFQIAPVDEERAERLAGDVRWHAAFG